MVSKQKTVWKEIGVCGVDSGQLIITDPSYVGEFDSSDYNERRVKKGIQDYSYSGCCAATQSKNSGGQVGKQGQGVVVSTGWGDGVYPVFVKYGNKKDDCKRIKEVRILFF